MISKHVNLERGKLPFCQGVLPNGQRADSATHTSGLEADRDDADPSNSNERESVEDSYR